MTHTNTINQDSKFSVANKVSLAAFSVCLLIAGNVSANEWDTNQSVTLDSAATPEQVKLMDWSKKMTASLNEKMNKKLQQIIIQAEFTQLLETKTRNMFASQNIK